MNLDAAKPFFNFFNDVIHAQQILVDFFKFALGFFFPLFEFGNAGRFFEDQPSLIRIGFKQCRNATLLNHAVGIHAHTRIEKEFAYVLEARAGIIDLILTRPIPKQSTADGHFIHIQIERARAVFFFGVLKDQHHLGHPRRLTAARSIEDHIHHRFAAQALGGLLTEHPLECVDDIRLATTVGSDNPRDRGIEHEFRPIGETLEALKNEFFEAHRHREVLHDRFKNSSGEMCL